MMTDAEAYAYMANEARNDTDAYEQAMREIAGGRKFADLPAREQYRVIQRAQALKSAR